MRDIDECRAEIFRRMDEGIKKRERMRKRIVTCCKSLCLCLAIGAMALLPSRLPILDYVNSGFCTLWPLSLFQWVVVVMFMVIFAASYAVIWGMTVRRSTAKPNEQLGHLPSRKAVMTTVAAAVNPFMWTSLDKLEECKGLFDEPVEEITLRTHTTYVTFNDEDLIAAWTAYLEHITVKRENMTRIDHANMNGSSDAMAIVTTKSGTYTIRCYDERGVYKVEKNEDGEIVGKWYAWEPGEYKIDIDGYVYAVKSDMDCPFDATYDEAVARYGATTCYGPALPPKD